MIYYTTYMLSTKFGDKCKKASAKRQVSPLVAPIRQAIVFPTGRLRRLMHEKNKRNLRSHGLILSCCVLNSNFCFQVVTSIHCAFLDTSSWWSFFSYIVWLNFPIEFYLTRTWRIWPCCLIKHFHFEIIQNFPLLFVQYIINSVSNSYLKNQIASENEIKF